MQQQTASIQTIRIIVCALAVGIVFFVGVTIFLNLTNGAAAAPAPGPAVSPQGAPSGMPDVMLIALGGLAATATMTFLLVPPLMIKQSAARWKAANTEAEREHVVMSSLSIVTIFRAALVEGVGLFGAVLFMLYGEWALLAAPALAVLLLLTLIPTQGKKEAMTTQLQRAGSER